DRGRVGDHPRAGIGGPRRTAADDAGAVDQPDQGLPAAGVAPEDVAPAVMVEIMARGESRPEETGRDESRRAASQRAEQSPESRFRLWTHCFLPPIVIVTKYARAIIFSIAAISVRPSTALEQPI